MNIKYGMISKVLPLVYDDTLTYYEILCKVVEKLNEAIDVDNAQSDAINELSAESAERYNQFERRILHDLEVMEQKLEGDIADGDAAVQEALSELIANLSNEIDDVSATVSGMESSVVEAVATANSASEAVSGLTSQLQTVTANVSDLADAIDDVEADVSGIDSRVTENTTNIGTNTSDISSLTSRVSDLEDEVSGLVFADVDNALSTTSTNPVENQVITRKIQQVEGDIPTSTEDLSDVNFTNPNAGQIVGFDANGDLVNMNAPAGVVVVDNLNSTSSTDALSANQGRILKNDIDSIVVPSVVDNLNSQSASDALSAKQGKVLKDTIDNIIVPTVLDSLSSTSTTDALSANQGKNLKDQLDAHEDKKVYSANGAHGIKYQNGNLSVYDSANAQWVIVNTGTSFALSPCVDISVTEGDEELTLKWTDPSDVVIGGTTVARWVGTKVIRKVGSAPVNENDGIVVVNSTVRNQYSVNGLVDTGLTNGTTYYYGFFPYTSDGIYNYTAVDDGTPEVHNITVTLTIDGAKEDNITIKDINDNTVGTCIFPSGATQGTCQLTIPVNGGTYKFISSVAKSTDGQNNDYSKNISLTSSLQQSINVMPDGALYWYGNQKIELTTNNGTLTNDRMLTLVKTANSNPQTVTSVSQIDFTNKTVKVYGNVSVGNPMQIGYGTAGSSGYEGYFVIVNTTEYTIYSALSSVGTKYLQIRQEGYTASARIIALWLE